MNGFLRVLDNLVSQVPGAGAAYFAGKRQAREQAAAAEVARLEREAKAQERAAEAADRAERRRLEGERNAETRRYNDARIREGEERGKRESERLGIDRQRVGLERDRVGIARSREARESSEGGASGRVSTGQARARDYWREIAEDLVAEAGGDPVAARNNAARLDRPETRRARKEGNLTPEMFAAAAQRFRRGQGTAPRDRRREELRGGLVDRYGKPSSALQQDLLDELQGGKTGAQILAEMRAAGVRPEFLKEAEEYLAGSQL